MVGGVGKWVENDLSVQPELSILGTEWFIDVGVGKGLNDSSVQTEPAIYDWIDTGTIWYKWWWREGGMDGQSEIKRC